MDALESGSILIESKAKIEGFFPIESDVVITGDFQAPDRSQFTVDISTNVGLTIQYEAIIIGQDAYQKLPFTDTWEQSPDPLDLITGSAYLGQLNLELNSETAQAISLVGPETLDGEDVIYLKGTLPAEVVAQLIGGEDVQSGSADVEIWIGVEDFLIRRMSMEYEQTDSTGATTTGTTTLTYSNYNGPVDIQAP